MKREMIRLSTDEPEISIVVIGLNVEKFIKGCLDSIFNSHYTQDKLEIIYVDSGSIDRSAAIAGSYKNVCIIHLNDPQPSAAKARNAGFRASTKPFIQFVDADSYLHPDWLYMAVKYLEGNVGAVSGRLHERCPQANWFHRMADLEWNLIAGQDGWTTAGGKAKMFGGNVLIRREIMEEANSYDESLPAGEDPDLSYRVRRMGWSILRLNSSMASHDINISGFSQYIKRTMRSGAAYARVAHKYFREEEKFFLQRIIRITIGALLPAILILSGIFAGWPLTGLGAALIAAFRLVLKSGKFARMYGISLKTAVFFSLHLALAVYPQFFGILSYIKEYADKMTIKSGKLIKQEEILT